MPAPRPSPRGVSGSGAVGDSLRTLLGFALIGCANTILPFIIFCASYLIIPYPRPAVILVETLPAVAAKIGLPHLLYYVPYWFRPVIFASIWAMVAFVSSVTAPNVEPPARVIASALASATAAATDASFLGLMRYYGKISLVGWGFGTGIGAITCAAMPYALTIRMGMFLRDAIDYVYSLAALTVLVYFVILPRKPSASPAGSDSTDQSEYQELDAQEAEHDNVGFFVKDPQPSARGFIPRAEQNLKLTRSLVPTYMLPLFAAFLTQAVVYPGISRALGASPAFDSFTGYSAAYGVAFSFGNLISRSSILFVRYQKARSLLIRLALVTVVVVINAFFLVVSLPAAMFVLAFLAGLIGGAVYINAFAAAMEDQALHSGSQSEFSLGVIGSGEAAGILVGSLVGTMLESAMCEMEQSTGQRWCQAVK